MMAWPLTATDHYMNRWWSSLLIHICVTRSQRVNPKQASCGKRMSQNVIFCIRVSNNETKTPKFSVLMGVVSQRLLTCSLQESHPGKKKKNSIITWMKCDFHVDSLLKSQYIRNPYHYSDVIMSTMASQITGFSIFCSTVGSGEAQRKHQSSASLAFVRGIHRWSVNSPHKRLVENVSIWWRHHDDTSDLNVL